MRIIRNAWLLRWRTIPCRLVILVGSQPASYTYKYSFGGCTEHRDHRTGSCSRMVGNIFFFCTCTAPVMLKAVYKYTHFPLPAGFQEDSRMYISAPINRTVHALPSFLLYDCNFLSYKLVLFHWKPVRQWYSPEINRGHFQGPKSGSDNFIWRIQLKLQS